MCAMGFCGSPSTALDDAAAAGTAADDDGTAADDAGTAADDDAGTAADDAGTAAADDDGAVADVDGAAADDGGALAHGGTAVDGGASSQSISVCVSASGSWLSFFTSLPSIMTHVDFECLTRTKFCCLNIEALAMVFLDKVPLCITRKFFKCSPLLETKSLKTSINIGLVTFDVYSDVYADVC